MGLFLTFLAAALASLSLRVQLVSASNVSNTILILARDANGANSTRSGLRGYGIPHEAIMVPQEGITLPPLTTGSNGNYGGIIIMSELSYQYPTGWASALSSTQWQRLYDYQTTFGVRMVRLDAFPSAQFGEALSASFICLAC
jgi:hypothetical protein